MKKLALTAAASLVMTLGAVVSTSGAQAADPYPGNVPTNCRVKVDFNSGKRGAVRVLTLVEVPSSKAQPLGLVQVTVKRKGKTVFTSRYNTKTGTTKKFFGPRLRKNAKYKAFLVYEPYPGTVFTGCQRKRTFKPKKAFQP